jgi:hypothetical protein
VQILHLHYAFASAQQVEEENDYRNNQKQVNEASGYVEAETEKPQNDENYEN